MFKSLQLLSWIVFGEPGFLTCRFFCDVSGWIRSRIRCLFPKWDGKLVVMRAENVLIITFLIGLPSLKLTARTWKLMVVSDFISFWGRLGLFSEANWTVSFMRLLFFFFQPPIGITKKILPRSLPGSFVDANRQPVGPCEKIAHRRGLERRYGRKWLHPFGPGVLDADARGDAAGSQHLWHRGVGVETNGRWGGWGKDEVGACIFFAMLLFYNLS